MKSKLLAKCIEKIEKKISHYSNHVDLNLVFSSDSELAQSVNSSKWIKANCGHDCCTCDQECK